jgi:hypothetical protein
MKKLLILLLVLGLAIAANAATYEISVNGNIDPIDSQINICPSDELELDIWSSGYAGIQDAVYLALVCDTAYGTISGGAVTAAAPSMSLIEGQSAAGDGYPCLNQGEDGPYVSIAGAYGETAGPGVYFDSFLFHCLQEGDVIVRLISSPDFINCNVEDTVTIHQIPEPASMLLLGLGGLLLRRRK